MTEEPLLCIKIWARILYDYDRLDGKDWFYITHGIPEYFLLLYLGFRKFEGTLTMEVLVENIENVNHWISSPPPIVDEIKFENNEIRLDGGIKVGINPKRRDILAQENGFDLCNDSPVIDSSSAKYKIVHQHELHEPAELAAANFIDSKREVKKKTYLPRAVVKIVTYSFCQYPGGIKQPGDDDTSSGESDSHDTNLKRPRVMSIESSPMKPGTVEK